MEIVYVSFRVIILYSLGNLILAKPFEEEKSMNEDNKLHCVDSSEGTDYGRNSANSFSDYYKPRSEKYPNRPFDYDKKRSTWNEPYNKDGASFLQKRQVGVVYKDDKPIGILQPYQRSYRFIPVRDDNSYGFNGQTEDVAYNLPSVGDIDKREANGLTLDSFQLDETYPSILTNFKIDNKLDKKRNYDALTDENVRDLKETIRRLRSSNSRNNEQIEEELKNILDDMGLIEDEEVHGTKRETKEQPANKENNYLMDEEKERNKRYDPCGHNDNMDVSNKAGISDHTFLNSDDKKSEMKNDMFSQKIDKRESTEDSRQTRRRKRQKQIVSTSNKENADLIENLKDSGDLMLSGNKSPLASSSEITVRETNSKESEKDEDDDEDYEKRVERQIQSKINSLKEQVKREIEALKKIEDEDDDEDIQRKKRQALNNLINEETDDVDPALNPDGELKPLIRKRRDSKTDKKSGTNSLHVRKKREAKFSLDSRYKRSERSDLANNQKNYKAQQEDTDEGGELLGGDDFGEEIYKRQAYPISEYDNNFNSDDVLYERDKRSGIQPEDLNYFYNNYFYDNGRLKRQNDRETDLFGESGFQNRFVPMRRNQWRSRLRRRINEDQSLSNRPQQLSDMSDLDLFGALPKSYSGELSRYKRVKRK